MPDAADFIVALLTLALGAGIGTFISLRKLKPEIDKLKVDKRVSEADVMLKLTEAMENLMGPLNDQVKMLQAGREDDRRRIRDLEKVSGEQGKELVDRDCKIAVLESKVKILEDELADWKAGRKRKTGPLAES